MGGQVWWVERLHLYWGTLPKQVAYWGGLGEGEGLGLADIWGRVLQLQRIAVQRPYSKMVPGVLS